MANNLVQKMLTISENDLQKQLGRYLDRVDLQNEAFIVERARKPKAALVSIVAFKQMARLQKEERAQELAIRKRNRKHVLAGDMTEAELDKLVELNRLSQKVIRLARRAKRLQ